MKREYVSPSVEAILSAEEPVRGFVFSSICRKDEYTGADRLLADVGESNAKTSMNKEISQEKE